MNEKRMKTDFWLWAIAALLAAILLCSMCSCQTFKGAMGDGAWLLQKGADNIQTAED